MQATVSRRAPTEESTTTEPSVVTLAELEKRAILTTLEQVKGDKLLAARLLNIGKTTLYRKLKEYEATP
jgi:two-component system response regulator HydG